MVWLLVRLTIGFGCVCAEFALKACTCMSCTAVPCMDVPLCGHGVYATSIAYVWGAFRGAYWAQGYVCVTVSAPQDLPRDEGEASPTEGSAHDVTPSVRDSGSEQYSQLAAQLEVRVWYL